MVVASYITFNPLFIELHMAQWSVWLQLCRLSILFSLSLLQLQACLQGHTKLFQSSFHWVIAKNAVTASSIVNFQSSFHWVAPMHDPLSGILLAITFNPLFIELQSFTWTIQRKRTKNFQSSFHWVTRTSYKLFGSNSSLSILFSLSEQQKILEEYKKYLVFQSSFHWVKALHRHPNVNHNTFNPLFIESGLTYFHGCHDCWVDFQSSFHWVRKFTEPEPLVEIEAFQSSFHWGTNQILGISEKDTTFNPLFIEFLFSEEEPKTRSFSFQSSFHWVKGIILMNARSAQW